jgi:hypothetical protein
MKNNLIFHHIYLIVSESAEMRVCVCRNLSVGCAKHDVLWTPKFPEQQTAKAKKIFRFLHNHLADFIEDFFVRRRRSFSGVAFDKKLALYVIILYLQCGYGLWFSIIAFNAFYNQKSFRTITFSSASSLTMRGLRNTKRERPYRKKEMFMVLTAGETIEERRRVYVQWNAKSLAKHATIID